MPSRSTLHFDLVEMLKQPGCPVCRLVDRDVRQYIDSFFYESITAVERRAEIRDARGFCSVHGSILAGHSRVLGTAIIHQDVINDVLRGFPAHTPQRSLIKNALSAGRDAVARTIRPRRECVLCAHERHQERIVLEALIAGMADDALRGAFEQSDGVCLPHLQSAMALRSPREENLRRFVALERAALERLKGQLELFIHKRNASYEHQAMGEEADAPARATKIVSGRVFGRRA
jgi:hypothetical protein